MPNDDGVVYSSILFDPAEPAAEYGAWLPEVIHPQAPCLPDCSGCPLAAQPPDDLEFTTVDGVFLREMIVAAAGSIVPQHSHRFDHTSFLAMGAVRVWQDGAYAGDYQAPVGIVIKAGVQHTFLTLADNTIIFCIHNLHGHDTVQIAAPAGGVR